MWMKLFLLYIDGKPSALIVGKDAEHAAVNFRSQLIGQQQKIGLVAAVAAEEAPFEDFVRTALIALWSQIYQSSLAQPGLRG